jgi:hypothetical protein
MQHPLPAKFSGNFVGQRRPLSRYISLAEYKSRSFINITITNTIIIIIGLVTVDSAHK